MLCALEGRSTRFGNSVWAAGLDERIVTQFYKPFALYTEPLAEKQLVRVSSDELDIV
ncbi:hypothetical protein BD626DRAFT_490404 [Schizophyllum amplum]|uniref:Uncharacterized protein n=1 Tax=Schizophyllum amplum TaxID=97359 RepID=A0A550CJG0_9AGAR|nr:hypothetical protein BD626DRAFT_490404 [Auriculariopsis ampla]